MHEPVDETQEGALDQYVRAILARKLVVALITLTAIGAAVAVVSARSPTYEATAQILVSPLPQYDETFLGIDLLRDSGDPTRTQQTAASLIESHGAAMRTATILGAGYTADEVEAAVSVQPLGQSNIVVVTASASSSQTAAKLANRYARSALALRAADIRRQVVAAIDRLRRAGPGDDRARLTQLRTVRERGDPTLRISQFAHPPPEPTQPPWWLLVALAALAGFTVGSVAALLLTRRAAV